VYRSIAIPFLCLFLSSGCAKTIGQQQSTSGDALPAVIPSANSQNPGSTAAGNNTTASNAPGANPQGQSTQPSAGPSSPFGKHSAGQHDLNPQAQIYRPRAVAKHGNRDHSEGDQQNTKQTDLCLKNEATKRGVDFFGTVVRGNALNDDQSYQDILKKHFNMIAPETELSLTSVCATEKDGTCDFNFEKIDKMAQFAIDQKISLRGTPLARPTNNPDWISKKQMDGNDALALFQKTITSTIQHFSTNFPGLIQYWDVVSDPLSSLDGKVRLQETPWSIIGGDANPSEYITEAFKSARLADPKLKLFYTDFDIENPSSNKFVSTYMLIKNYIQAKVPIDGIGFKIHGFYGVGSSQNEMTDAMQRFVDLGLEVQIVELDSPIQLEDNGTATPSFEKLQSAFYKKAIAACLNVKANPNTKLGCTAVVTNGFTDKYWTDEYNTPGLGCPLYFDKDLKPKAAYASILEALQGK